MDYVLCNFMLAIPDRERDIPLQFVPLEINKKKT